MSALLVRSAVLSVMPPAISTVLSPSSVALCNARGELMLLSVAVVVPATGSKTSAVLVGVPAESVPPAIRTFPDGSAVAVAPTLAISKGALAAVNFPVAGSNTSSWVVAAPVMVLLTVFLVNFDLPPKPPATSISLCGTPKVSSAPTPKPSPSAIEPSLLNFLVVGSKNSAPAVDLFPLDQPPARTTSPDTGNAAVADSSASSSGAASVRSEDDPAAIEKSAGLPGSGGSHALIAAIAHSATTRVTTRIRPKHGSLWFDIGFPPTRKCRPVRGGRIN